MPEHRFDVVGIGNAIVDVLSHADDAFLDHHGLPKGAMTLIDNARARALYRDMGPARARRAGPGHRQCPAGEADREAHRGLPAGSQKAGSG